MSDNLQYIDPDADEYDDAPVPLREHVKKLQKALDRTKAERDQFRTQSYERAFSDVLADKGFKNPARVQRDMLSDQVDPADSAAVTTWLAANSDDYARAEGFTPPEATPAAEAEQPNPEAQNYERLTVPGQTSGGALDPYQAAMAEVGANPTPAELRAAFIKQGL